MQTDYGVNPLLVLMLFIIFNLHGNLSQDLIFIRRSCKSSCASHSFKIRTCFQNTCFRSCDYNWLSLLYSRPFPKPHSIEDLLTKRLWLKAAEYCLAKASPVQVVRQEEPQTRCLYSWPLETILLLFKLLSINQDIQNYPRIT